MEKRTLGKTGEELSVVGFGAIVFVNESPQFVHETVARAIDAGVNYFDMGPRYGGRARPEAAEELGGPAIQPYRDRVFLAEKTGEFKKADAAAQLRQSLKLMRTDHFDLYQLHGVSTFEEVETIVGPGGALEAFVEARDAGLVRFLGFFGPHRRSCPGPDGPFRFRHGPLPRKLRHLVSVQFRSGRTG